MRPVKFLSVSGNRRTFEWFIERLRTLISTSDCESLKNVIIDVYQEYNASFPKEFVEDLPEEIEKIIKSIKNLD